MADLEWGPPSGWCRISASVDKPEFKASENVYITVVVRNASAAPVPYAAHPFAPDVDYHVTSADGKPVPLTAYGHGRKDAIAVASSRTEQLAPGEAVVYEILLGRVYDLTLAGTYRFQVAKEMGQPGQAGGPSASSNVLEFEVLSDE
jgi:hypothetical protein